MDLPKDGEDHKSLEDETPMPNIWSMHEDEEARRPKSF